MASEVSETYDNQRDWLETEMSVRRQAQDEVAYEYLCRLEEAKKWMEAVLNEELPSTLQLEEYLQNGVILCKLTMKLLPDEPMWKKVYDLDQSKFKAAREQSKGLDYRYTDNINFWLTALQKLGLPKVFYPVMTDIYHRKNMPKLIYCLHALSHLLKKKGKVSSAVDDLYGTLKFASDAVSQTSETLKAYHGKTDMPAFGVVENLVEEELQYQAMGLYDSFEEDISPSPSNSLTRVSIEELFDDPKYISSTAVQHGQPMTTTEVNGSGSETDGSPFASITCTNSAFTASLYLSKQKSSSCANGSPVHKTSIVEVAVNHLNEVLKRHNAIETLKALKNPDGNFPFTFQKASKYHTALLKEKEEGLPGNILPVFSGIDRDICDSLLEKMIPGAYIVRSSKSVAGAYVFSFRNQTGIKHWKLSTKSGKYFWGHSPLYSSIDGFVENFVDALSLVTKLYVFCGMTTALQPMLQTPEHKAIVDSLRESDSNLSYGQICKVITEVNSEIRHGRKSSSNEPHDHSPAQGKSWDTSMIAKVNRTEAYKMLNEIGEPGSFIIRHSDSTPGDFALTFRTKDETRHWKIASNQGKYYVHPRPQPYESLDEIVDHFREAVGQETGLVMDPLQLEKTDQTQESQLCVPMDDRGSASSSLKRDTITIPSPGESVIPSLSLSKLNPANLTSWTCEDVCCWLLQQDLGRFIQIFQENAVDGECLLTLDNTLLKNDLGIDALGHRSRILRRLQALKEQMHPQLM